MAICLGIDFSLNFPVSSPPWWPSLNSCGTTVHIVTKVRPTPIHLSEANVKIERRRWAVDIPERLGRTAKLAPLRCNCTTDRLRSHTDELSAQVPRIDFRCSIESARRLVRATFHWHHNHWSSPLDRLDLSADSYDRPACVGQRVKLILANLSQHHREHWNRTGQPHQLPSEPLSDYRRHSSRAHRHSCGMPETQMIWRNVR